MGPAGALWRNGGEFRVKLAVFTSKYPARVATFFERDMRSLIEAGVELDVFPIYPLDGRMWRYAQPLLDADVLPRERVHHLGFASSLARAVAPPARISPPDPRTCARSSSTPTMSLPAASSTVRSSWRAIGTSPIASLPRSMCATTDWTCQSFPSAPTIAPPAS